MYIIKKSIKISLVLLFCNLNTFGQDFITQNSIDSESSGLLVLDNENSFKIFNSLTDSIRKKSKRDVPWFVERFKISAGFFGTLNNTSVKVGNNSGNIGTTIDFENNLGFDTYSNSFFADVQWRSTSRSRFSLNYYNLKRSANYRIRESFNFGNNTYNANADINAYFNSSIYRFSYGYAIISKQKYEIGLLIGTHIIDAKAGIGLIASGINSEVNDNFGFTVPLPDFGIWGGYTFNNRWAINGEFDYLAVKINDIRGQILAYNLSVLMRVNNHLNLSSGLTGLGFKVDAYNDNLNGHLRWGNNGAFIKASYIFGNKNWN